MRRVADRLLFFLAVIALLAASALVIYTVARLVLELVFWIKYVA